MSYDPTLILDLAETTLTFGNDNLHWAYVVVTVVVDAETGDETQTAAIVASEAHIDPLQFWESDGQIYYKIGHFSPVVDGKREAHLLWNGVKGGSGASGKSAYEIAVLNGFVGTEVEWLASLVGSDGNNGTNGTNGVDGKSAYQTALDNGFVGTEAAWLASLHGTNGTNGTNGQGVAAGGTTNQKLVKNSNDDYDTKWVDDVSVDNSVVVYIDFKALTAFVYTCPAALKFTSQTSQSTAATLSVALNTNMTQYQQLTVTPTALGLVTLTGVLL